jgi:hypothetical protein
VIRGIVKGANGRTILLLGLDKEGVRRLTSGEPVFVDGRTVGLETLDVVVMYGETIRDVMQELKKAGIKLPDVPQVGIPFDLSARAKRGKDDK